ncbi:MAG: thioredoxin [Lachnospiraceae bacterium]|nr:thioredoxin [Lachnospiraceae bacterium]MBR6399339.1 thioredoxin [Lachnospiraceae bacterium]
MARVIIGAIAAGFIFYGVLSGGLLQVMNKAIRICMECIGLG